MSMYHLDHEELRGIILGTTTFRKCLMCNGTGQTEDEHGEDQNGSWTAMPDQCEYCKGLGFIKNTKG